jgi:hypothetical protein
MQSASSLVILPASLNSSPSSSSLSSSSSPKSISTPITANTSSLINKNETFNLTLSAGIPSVGSGGGGGVCNGNNSLESHLITAANSTKIYKNLNQIFILSPSLTATTTTTSTSNQSSNLAHQQQSPFELFPFTTASAAHFQAAVNSLSNSVNPVSSNSNSSSSNNNKQPTAIAPKIFPKKERLIKPNPAHLVSIRPNLFPDKVPLNSYSSNNSNGSGLLLQGNQSGASPNKSETATLTISTKAAKTPKKRKSASISTENVTGAEQNKRPVKKRQTKKEDNSLSVDTTVTSVVVSTPLVKRAKRIYKRAQAISEETAHVPVTKAKRKKNESKKNSNVVDAIKSTNSEANTSISSTFSSSCSSSSSSSSSSYSLNGGIKNSSNTSDLTTAISKSLFGKINVCVCVCVLK